MENLMDTAVSFARDHVFPYLMEVANIIRGVPKDVSDMKDELQRIQDLIHDTDKMAAAEEGNTRNEIRKKVMQLIDIAYRMEDVIDEYMIHEEQQPDGPRCAALPCEPGDLVRTLKLRFQIANKIAEIKSLVREVNSKNSNDFEIKSFQGQGASSSRRNQSVTWQHLQEDALYMDQSEIVGFDGPRDKLIGWLVKGRKECTVIFVVGMGGQGKTTLANSVFGNKEVIHHFDCQVWITVSQSYTVEGLLKDMLQKLYKVSSKSAQPQHISTLDQKESLIKEVRNYLREKRYVVFFDDVWNKQFWNEIKNALIDNKQGSRVVITTRDMNVVKFCKSYAEIHELQPLTKEKSWELFCKSAFRNKNGESCPTELEDISHKFVEKCDGLPLAIVAMAGLFSAKEKSSLEWEKFYINLNSELDKDSHLAGITKILGFSYNDLPYYHQSCFLYFGMYPEDFEVKSKRLLRQWVAEGFVKREEGKTLEEVGKEYLEELIQRNLVQVSSLTMDGKIRGCRVHDLYRELIIRKFKELSFCQWISEDNEPCSGGNIIRRMSVATNSSDLMENVESSHVRSLLFFKYNNLPEDFMRRILTKYKLLKLLDLENAGLNPIPEDLGKLIHLRYLSLSYSCVFELPKSIGKLHNLETLDLRQTDVHMMPKEVTELRKLRHLLVYASNWSEMEDGIGDMKSLETIRRVSYPTEKLITALGNLTRLRKLGILNVEIEHRSKLQSSINAMKKLENLVITYRNASEGNQFLDGGHSISVPHLLRKLHLELVSYKFPEWIPQLQHVVKLTLLATCLTEDPLKSLKDMKNLMLFSLMYYGGENLHFHGGGFRKLKKLYLGYSGCASITIEEEALQCLEKLELENLRNLKTLPHGIQNLKKLEVLDIKYMDPEFLESIDYYRGQDRWIFHHVPQVNIVVPEDPRPDFSD